MKRFRSWLALPLVVPILAACGGDQDVERPSPLYGQVPIEYPVELWDRGIEGETLLRVRVDDLGRVDSVEVAVSSGHLALDSAAVTGARELRFSPGRKSGKRITVWANVPVHFSLGPPPRGQANPPQPDGPSPEPSSEPQDDER